MFLQLAVSSPTTKPEHLMHSHGQRRRNLDQSGGRDLPRFMGVTPPCFTIPNADQTQPCLP
ncbi:unnamed protein product [Prunus brigantina]